MKISLKLFIGRHVSILLRHGNITTSVSEAGVQIDETPLIVNDGYILGMDEQYFYLGDSPEGISSAVNRSDVSVITITEPDSEDDSFSLANKSEMN